MENLIISNNFEYIGVLNLGSVSFLVFDVVHLSSDFIRVVFGSKQNLPIIFIIKESTFIDSNPFFIINSTSFSSFLHILDLKTGDILLNSTIDPLYFFNLYLSSCNDSLNLLDPSIQLDLINKGILDISNNYLFFNV